MSKTEGFLILNSQDAATTGAKREAKPPLQSVPRRRLADISNLPQNVNKPSIQGKSQSIETTNKVYIDQLQKENMALVEMLAQRNKIIEQNGAKLDRMRVNMLKMQEQNQQLASANAQMLVELNSGKDREKKLQHELGCINGLLQARKPELEGNAITKPSINVDAQSQEEGDSSKEGKNIEKPQETKMALQSNSLSSSAEVQSKEKKTENKRRFTRRQSAIFKPSELKPVDDLFENNDSILPESLLSDDPVPEKGSTAQSLICEAQESGRPPLCRPSRLAAKKVQSYKEIPTNVKMRRT